MDDVLVFLGVMGVLGSLDWIILELITNLRRRKIGEVHMKLLEKFGSSQEMLAYMETSAGKRFLDSATVEPARTNPYSRILWAVQVGLVLAPLGAALLLLRRPVPEDAEGFLVFGSLAVALSIGFILAAAASYALSKSFGLFEGTSPRREDELGLGRAGKGL